jgi:hypothetical protein
MRAVLFVLSIIVMAAPVAAADGISTWTSGNGPAARTYVFKMDGGRVIGVVCGPCDDPSHVYRITGRAASDADRLSLSVIGADSSWLPPQATLTRVDGDAKPVSASISYLPPQTSPSLDGRWVAAGRVAQQNVTLKLREGSTVWGVICGPCDKPAGVFLIEDGKLDGDAISFFIHHTDRRNFMKGAITGNVMKFKWVREGHENEPGGEMTLIGPIR